MQNQAINLKFGTDKALKVSNTISLETIRLLLMLPIRAIAGFLVSRFSIRLVLGDVHPI